MTALLMAGRLSFALLCLLLLLRQANAQEVIIAREAKPQFPRAEPVTHPQPRTELHVEKAIAVQPVKAQVAEKTSILPPPAIAQVRKQEPNASQLAKMGVPGGQAIRVSTVNTPPKQEVAVVRPLNSVSEKRPAISPQPLKAEVHSVQTVKPALANAPVQKQEVITASSLSTANHSLGAISAQPIDNHFDTAFIRLADGFDFPVGKPDAQGYYKARGFRSHGHLGEDWDGVRGGDTDLGDPIYSIGDGLVVFARDCHMGWGNVVIVRHSYREGGAVKNIDALYAHLNSILVHRGQAVARGQRIATMGTAHGLYDAHLHLEIRKNIEIGMSRTAFAQDFSNYYDPSQFILAHRHLSSAGGTYRVAMNTFVRDAHINFDRAKNYSHSHSGGGTSESAAALKKASASQH
jgi:murein DD-endopeptidase MepM/ murein hydrolase activator NlpD